MSQNLPAFTPGTTISNGEQVNAVVSNRQHIPANSQLITISDQTEVITGNSNTTITSNQGVLIYCTNTSDITITLPTASLQSVIKPIKIKKSANNAALVTILCAGADTIENPINPLTTPTETSLILRSANSSVTLNSQGNTWRVLDYFYPSVVKVVAALTGFITLVANVASTVVFNSEFIDINNNYNQSTGVFTAPYDGYYQFSGTSGFFNSNAHNDSLTLEINNVEFTTLHQSINGAGVLNAFSFCTVLFLVRNNEVRFRALSNAATVVRGDSISRLQIIQLGL